MRYVRIFLLHFQYISELRARSLVWFLLPIIDTAVLIIFWSAALSENKQIFPGWNFRELVSYYLLLILASSLLMAHIEDDVSKEDIKQGHLVFYITKPFSYFFLKLFSELTPRVLQGIYALVVILAALFLFGSFLTLANSLPQFFLTIFIWVNAFLISFLFKMIIGLFAFWFTDIWGFHQLMEVIAITFSGLIMPIILLPNPFDILANFLPFSYMIGYPILSVMGKLEVAQQLNIVFIQIFFLTLFSLIYKFTWKKGVQQFVGVGQ